MKSAAVSEIIDWEAEPDEASPDGYRVRAEREFATGRFQEAALIYFPVALSEPGNSNALFNLALCFERSERWELASDMFERVLKLDPQRPDARLGLGACLLHLKRFNGALAIFDRCIRDGIKP